MMKKLFAACAVLSLASSAFAAAPETAAPQVRTAQQNKMVTCNASASGKQGDERKSFMKQCLSAPAVSSARTAQQMKMKTCNVDAAGKQGDERKAFMKTCLSSPKP